MSRLPEAAAGMSDCFRAAISGSSVTGFGRTRPYSSRWPALQCGLPVLTPFLPLASGSFEVTERASVQSSWSSLSGGTGDAKLTKEQA